MPQETSQPNKSILTPFNIVAGVLIIAGLILTVLRFTKGLGAVTNLDDNNPWGIWIGFDLLCGVALAAGGYVTSAACYIFGLKRFHSAVRPAILTAFLGYALVVLALHYDVGRPWRLPYPIFVSPGTTSLLYEVGLCVFLYLTVLFVEYSPAALEWLGLKRVRNLVVRLTLVLTIFGVVLSTLHQSSLGALFMIAPSKLHPLWYSGYLPVYFFVSSIFAGLSMVIFEGTLAHNQILKEKIGFSFFTLPPAVVDFLTWGVVISALLLVLRRIALPEVRILTTAYDYLILFLATAPFVTGLIARYQIGDYSFWLIVHILFGEALLVAIPFTKLSHIILFFASRAQLGMDYAIKRGGG